MRILIYFRMDKSLILFIPIKFIVTLFTLINGIKLLEIEGFKELVKYLLWLDRDLLQINYMNCLTNDFMD